MKSIMHEMEERVLYMTLGGLDFESNGEGFFIIYVIVVDIMKIVHHYMMLHLCLYSYSSIAL